MSEIWVIKDTAPVDEASRTLNQTNILFTSDNKRGTYISIYDPSGSAAVLVYGNIGDVAGMELASGDTAFTWVNEAYKALEFDTAPTGELLAWLQKNADKQVDTEYLTNTAELTAIANAIREKGGTSAQLVYPTGFVSAIQAIQTGVPLQITVATNAGATVTATKDSKTVSGTADTSGHCTLTVDEAGTWTVTATAGSTIKTADVAVGTANIDLIMSDPIFGNNSWADIIKACQEKQVPDTWNVGDSCNMTINGTDYQIDIIGKNHDDYADGSGKAPLTFQMHNSYGTAYAMNSTSTNVGGWKECAMRKTHLPTILALMPAEVQSGIREVSKITLSRDTSGNPTMDTTSEKLFLLSEVEVFNSIKYSTSGEGSQYAYYGASGSTVKTLNGRDTSWWLRSPMSTSDYSFCASSAGDAPTNLNATDERGAAFAFCF